MKHSYIEDIDNKNLAILLVRVIKISLTVSFIIYSCIMAYSIISRSAMAKEYGYDYSYILTDLEDTKRIEEYNSFDK